MDGSGSKTLLVKVFRVGLISMRIRICIQRAKTTDPGHAFWCYINS
jgi:hypothetical protein